jgi:hypothetical protein
MQLSHRPQPDWKVQARRSASNKVPELAAYLLRSLRPAKREKKFTLSWKLIMPSENSGHTPAHRRTITNTNLD